MSFGRPQSDISAGNWTGEPTSSLYDKLDESTASDTDYIWTPTRGDTAEVKLSPITGAVSSGTVRVRAKRAPMAVVQPVVRTVQPQGAVGAAGSCAPLALYTPAVARDRYAVVTPFTPTISALTLAAYQGELTGKFTGPAGASESISTGIPYTYTYPRGLTLVVRARLQGPWDGGWRVLANDTSVGNNGAWGIVCSTASGVDTISTLLNVDGVSTSPGMYVDGEYVGTSYTNNRSRLRTIVVPMDSPVRQGFYTASFGGGTGVIADLSLLGVLDRKLSASEARSVSANPWQLFSPQRRTTFPGATLTTSLVENTTVRASWSDPLTLTDTTYEHALTTAEAASITAGSDLRLRFKVD